MNTRPASTSLRLSCRADSGRRAGLCCHARKKHKSAKQKQASQPQRAAEPQTQSARSDATDASASSASAGGSTAESAHSNGATSNGADSDQVGTASASTIQEVASNGNAAPASQNQASEPSTSSEQASTGGFVPLRRPEQAQKKWEAKQAASASAAATEATPTPTQEASTIGQDAYQPAVKLARPRSERSKAAQSSITAISRDKGSDGSGFLPPELLKKVGLLVGLVAASRVGVYTRLPGVDISRFSENVSNNGILGYIDNITGGSISNVGVFSLGIIPAINASIFLQVLTITFPSLKKLQREEGPQGRARYQLYQKLATLGFAVLQSFGQLSALKPYAVDPSPQWFLSNIFALVAGAMIVNQLADYITELKLGNGTSVLIFANIASFVPISIGSTFQQAGASNSSGIAIYFVAFLLTTFGVVIAQTAERRVPVNSASRYDVGKLTKQNYFPFKVNGTGVMPVIFASSFLGIPPALLKLSGIDAGGVVAKLQPGGALYLPLEVLLIVVINYFYTFVQYDPNDISDNLKRGQSSIPGCRPGRQTAEYVSARLGNMAWLGSIFLAVLSCAPVVTEQLTGVSALRGFAGTSVLIVVGVATDVARRIRAEKQMSKYGNIDELYDNL